MKLTSPHALSAACALLFGGTMFSPALANHTYRQVNLVSDQPGVARRTDPNLVNPWGLAIRPGGRIIVADNGTGLAQLYTPRGRASRLAIHVPSPGGTGTGTPTGLTQNFDNDFMITDSTRSGPARVIIATEDGTILGWNPNVNPTNAIVAVDNSGSNAVYKGITRGRVGGTNFIYAANFRAGLVEMYDGDFNFVRSFTDDAVPSGFAPFNVRNIGGRLFVTFAKQLAPDNEDDEPGPGNGFVDIFDLKGNFVRRFASHGTLNSPWGIVRAPFHFGRFSGALLVGNFGDGRINAFDPDTGAFLGQLADRNGDPIEIDGLWGLTFGVRLAFVSVVDFGFLDEFLVEVPVLYFTAGPDDETHGLFGFIRSAFFFGP